MDEYNFGACVYKIEYILGYFYFGSTWCFVDRMRAHNRNHSTGSNLYQRALSWSDVVEIKIIAVGDDILTLRRIEADLIKEHINDPKILNDSVKVSSRVERQKILVIKNKKLVAAIRKHKMEIKRNKLIK